MAGVAASLLLWWALGHEETGELERRIALAALIAGLLISALLTSLVHVSQTSRARAAALAHANVSLRERIHATTSRRGRDPRA